MARTQKVGLDYFPHDADIMSDQKMRIIKAKHGLIGYAVYMRLLEEIYRDKGYYLEHNDDFVFIFCDDNNIAVNDYINMINDYINYDLFDINIFNAHKVLTSKRIQLTYLEATKRRQIINIEQHLVIDCKEVNAYISNDNVNINQINDNNGTQSKEEKSKVNRKKSIEEHIVGQPDGVPYKEILDYLNTKAEKNYKPSTKAHCTFIKARWNEGHRLEQFKRVIDVKTKEWLNTEQDQYLRPATLFGTKFEGYLNQKEIKDKPKSMKDNQTSLENNYGATRI